MTTEWRVHSAGTVRRHEDPDSVGFTVLLTSVLHVKYNSVNLVEPLQRSSQGLSQGLCGISDSWISDCLRVVLSWFELMRAALASVMVAI